MTATPAGAPLRSVSFLPLGEPVGMGGPFGRAGVAASRARLDWAEFYGRQRAGEMDLRVAQVLVVERIDAERMGMSYRVLRAVDAAYVITPDLAHLGETAEKVTAFAELLTVVPAKRFRWRMRVSAGELALALEVNGEDQGV